jgi:anti-sigma factor ChrR (cupin superfamily)
VTISSASRLAFDREKLKARDFEPLRPGVMISRLYEDEATGASAAVLRYAPGGRVPKHRHDGYEHVYVLEGEQSDENGSYPAGSFVINAPGSAHSVWSDSGCLALLVWSNSITFL